MLAARSLKLRLETLVTVWRTVRYLRTMRYPDGGGLTAAGADPA